MNNDLKMEDHFRKTEQGDGSCLVCRWCGVAVVNETPVDNVCFFKCSRRDEYRYRIGDWYEDKVVHTCDNFQKRE